MQQFAQKSVALQYRVPLPLITDQRQTLNNYREGKLALYDDAVLPLARRLLGSALVSRRNDELKKRREIGVEDVNELREIMGRKPKEGGDVLYLPVNMQPMGADPFAEDELEDEPEELELEAGEE
jgi:hypothetical protein